MHPESLPLVRATPVTDRWPISVAAGLRQVSDNFDNEQTLYNANIAYVPGNTGLYTGYLRSRDNTGLVDTLLP